MLKQVTEPVHIGEDWTCWISEDRLLGIWQNAQQNRRAQSLVWLVVYTQGDIWRLVVGKLYFFWFYVIWEQTGCHTAYLGNKIWWRKGVVRNLTKRKQEREEWTAPVKMFRLQWSVKSTCLLTLQTNFLILCLPLSSSRLSTLSVRISYLLFFFSLNLWHFIFQLSPWIRNTDKLSSQSQQRQHSF